MQEPTLLVGDRELPIPEASLDDLDTYQAEFDEINAGVTDPKENWSKVRAMAKIVSEVLHAANPDIPLKDIKKAIPLGKAAKYFAAVMGRTNDPKTDPQQLSTS